jgi:3-hydroxyacyl-CoA dehydrogenase
MSTDTLLGRESPKAERDSFLIRKVAVLGAGTMGSRIAAHLANAGIPVVLLDVSSSGQPAEVGTSSRSALATAAVETLKKSKPAAFVDGSRAKLITAGNFDDDLHLLRDCDWIIEAIAEKLEIKRDLLKKVVPFRRQDAIVTTNTSGLPIYQIAEQLDEGFRRHWFGTHFFNPPRYMRLVEIIAGPQSDPKAIATISDFVDRRLGKAPVLAKDTPNFIGNRIGTFALLNNIRVMELLDLTIEDVDALTGAILGWPKTGTFRLGDLVGIDVLSNVAKNFEERITDERNDVKMPEFISSMIEQNWLGDKRGQGFYKKVRESSGEARLGLDWKTLSYRPSDRVQFPLLEMAKNATSIGERLKLILAADPGKDRAAAFYWQILPELWNYSAHRIGEVSDDLVSIDKAMKTGFNWQLGPFEMWDEVGVEATLSVIEKSGRPMAPALQKLLSSGKRSWYQNGSNGKEFFDPQTSQYKRIRHPAGVALIADFKRSNGVVKKNSGASLIDLGDGIGVIEFHTKMNAVGNDILSFVLQTLKPDGEFVRNFRGFVITNDSDNFSAGANLMQLLLSIQEQEWDEISAMIQSFQRMTQAIKFCPRPVVAAPFGLCLGGGTEIAIHAAARQAHIELYTGLVEAGVGLIPAGGGCKESVLAVMDAASPDSAGRADSIEVLDALRARFENIAMAKMSASAIEARSLGYLRASDSITFNRERLLSDAKRRVLAMIGSGYAPPTAREDIPVPGENALASLRTGVRHMREGEFISDHDVTVANWIAYILCGGKVNSGTRVTEQYLLDLEREAFLSLCGEQKTAERIAYTLKSGKPLRN